MYLDHAMYLGRYIDDCVGTASCSRGELECFINYVKEAGNEFSGATDQGSVAPLNSFPASLIMLWHPW